MIDAYTQQKFASACARSANEYTAASISAFGDGLAQSMRFWSSATDAWLSAWTGRATAQGLGSRTSGPKLWLAPYAGSQSSLAWIHLCAPAVNPFALWLSLFATARMFGPMPLAGAMIAAGVPAGTAWPAARAGSAAIDAAEIATKAMERAFSSYRSDGGHAVAQIKMLPSDASPHAASADLWAFNPWLALMRAK